MMRGLLIMGALLLLFGMAGGMDRRDRDMDLTSEVDRAAVMAWMQDSPRARPVAHQSEPEEESTRWPRTALTGGLGGK